MVARSGHRQLIAMDHALIFDSRFDRELTAERLNAGDEGRRWEIVNWKN